MSPPTPQPVCVICGKRLIRYGGSPALQCPLHGTRGQPPEVRNP